MPVAVTVGVVLFSILYFRKVEHAFLKEGLLLGITWFALSLFIDLLMFMPANSPIHMTFPEYMMDISITYLIIPVITVGFGYLKKSG